MATYTFNPQFIPGTAEMLADVWECSTHDGMFVTAILCFTSGYAWKQMGHMETKE